MLNHDNVKTIAWIETLLQDKGHLPKVVGTEASLKESEEVLNSIVSLALHQLINTIGENPFAQPDLGRR